MPFSFKFSFGDPTLADQKNVIIRENQAIINYPCSSHSKCTYVSFTINPGHYRFELFGASGGFSKNFEIQQGLQSSEDTECAGGYVSADIRVPKPTTFFLHIGGHGSHYQSTINSNEGGYNGGGGAEGRYPGTGGGATDIRYESNTPFHRILVAGGGGGSDDFSFDMPLNDGPGGAGGGLIAQSFIIGKQEYTQYSAKQDYGFSFFQGEKGLYQGSNNEQGYHHTGDLEEKEGGGGGWFGGFSSHHSNGGGGGGSSFALTRTAMIPNQNLQVYDEDYNPDGSPQKYAFDPTTSTLTFHHVIHKRGVWIGHGLAIISLLQNVPSSCYHHPSSTLSLFIIYLFVSK